MSPSGGGGDSNGPAAPPEDEETRIARLEVENGFRQYDETIEAIGYYLDPERPFALRPSLIQQLQSIAVDGTVPYPGQWRTTPVKISKSQHQPPDAHLVPSLIQEMCDYVNDNLHEQSPLHHAAYVMWRLNWIHPFEDGNGRTSRAVSYLVLCTGLKLLLPGSPTIPQQIQEDRSAYFKALEAAPAARKKPKVYANAFEALFAPEEAANLVARAELMRQIKTYIRRKGWSQIEAAEHCEITQPRMSALFNNHIDKFSLDSLVNIATALGWRVTIKMAA